MSIPSQEEHPEVTAAPRSAEEAVLHLVHRKAYETAAARARGLRVLDVGCNNGYGTRALAAEAASVVGVDVSPALIARAIATGVPDNVEFRRVDGGALPFEDGAFDLVTSFQVIEHVEDTDAFLREIRRVLKPGGGALFTTPNAAVRLDPGMRPWNRFHVREYRPDELREALAPWFAKVEILGLFGSPELHGIELARLTAARDEARRLQRRRGRLAARVRRLWRRVVPARPPEARPFAHLGPDDLSYRADDLDRALDLLALCSKAS